MKFRTLLAASALVPAAALAAPGAYNWNAATNTTWNTTDANWSGTGTVWVNGGDAVLGTSASDGANRVVTLTTGLSATTMAVNTTGYYFINTGDLTSGSLTVGTAAVGTTTPGAAGGLTLNAGNTVTVTGASILGGNGGNGIAGDSDLGDPATNGAAGGSGAMTVLGAFSTGSIILGGTAGATAMDQGIMFPNPAFNGNGGAGGTGTLNVTGNLTVSGATTIRAGSSLNLGFDGASAAAIGTVSLGAITNNGAIGIRQTSGSVTLAGVISGSGSLTVNTAGTAILTADNTYTGGTTITAGTLQLGDGSSAAGTVASNITNNGNLTLNHAGAYSYAGVVSGTGSLTHAAGTSTLSGQNTYTGDTFVTGGTLTLGHATDTLKDTANVIVSGGTLALGANADTIGTLYLSGGSVTATTGTLTVTGNTGLAGGSLAGALTSQALTVTGTGSSITAGASTATGLQIGTHGTSGDGFFTSGTAGTSGLLTHSGGALTVAGTTQIGGNGGSGFAFLGVTPGGNGGNGTLNLAGGALTTTDLALGGFAGLSTGAAGGAAGSGTLNLSGTGALTVSGTTTIRSSGTLNIGWDGTTASPPGTIALGAVVNDGAINLRHTSGSVEFSQIIAGTTGTITLSGIGGTTILSANNTFSGAITVNTGATLQVGNGGPTGDINGPLTNNGTLVANTTRDFTIADAIGGNGNFTQAGSGNITVTATQTSTGLTTVSNGTLTLGHATDTIADAASVTVSGGTLALGANSDTIGALSLNSGSITGTGILTASSVAISGGTLAGKVTTTGNASLSGGTVSGDLVAGAISVTGTSSAITGGTSTATGLAIGTAGGAGFGGTPGMYIPGPFDPVLMISIPIYIPGIPATSGASGTAGTLTLSDGSLAVSGGTQIGGSGGLTVAGGGGVGLGGNGGDGTLAITGGSFSTNTLSLGHSTVLGGLNGTGTLSVSGTGALTASGATTINSGSTLSLGWDGTAASTTGAISLGDITNNGTLAFRQSTGTITLGGVISGAGSIAVNTGGTVILSGTNTFTGTTLVSSGKLSVTGTHTGDTTVASGGTLTGSGTLGNTTVDAGGVLSQTAGSTLTTGNLTLNADAILNVTLGAPSSTGLFQVNGDLALDGTVNITETAPGDLAPGLYRLVNYTGTLTDNGLTVGTTPTSATVGSYAVSTATTGEVNLITGAAATGDHLLWDGAGTAADSVITGGTGTWTTTATNWTNATGSTNAAQSPQPGPVIFTGTAGTVTIDNTAGQVGVTGLQFASDGYTVTGGDLALSGTTVDLRAGDGTAAGATLSATIASALTGTGAVNKTDLGTLTLSGNNTYTGNTTVTAGTLRAGSASAFSTGSVAVTADATLDIAGNALGNALTLAGTGATGRTSALVNTGAAATLTGPVTLTAATTIGEGDITLAGATAGDFTLTKTGSGTLTLAGASASKSLAVTGGTLALGASDRLADDAALTVSGVRNLDGSLSGGTFTTGAYADTIGTLTVTDATVAGSGTLTAATYTLNGALITGRLGAGTLTVTGGINELTGSAAATTVRQTGGSLFLKNGAALADTAAVTVTAGNLAVVDAETIGSLHTSAGSEVTLQANLTLQSGGDLAGDLVGAGQLIIQAGTTVRSAAGFTGAYRTESGVLEVTAHNRTLDNTVTGSGSFLLSGSGTTTLAASRLNNNHAYVGAGHTLDLGTDPATTQSAALTILSGGTLRGQGSTGALTLEAGATHRPGNSPGIVNVTGDYTNNGALVMEIAGTGGAGAATGHDQINATGAIRLGGTLDVVFINGFAPASGVQPYSLFTSGTNTFTGFNAVALPTNTLGLLRVNSGTLTYTTYSSFALLPGASLTPDQIALADALIAGGTGTGTAAGSLLDAYNTGGATALAGAVTGTAPRDLGALTTLALDEARASVDTIRQRLDLRRRTTDWQGNAWAAYASVTNTRASVDESDSAATFDRSIFGGKIGLENKTSPELTLGGNFGYDHGRATVHRSGGRYTQEHLGATGYLGRTFDSRTFVYAGIFAGLSSYEADRRSATLGNASGDTAGRDVGATVSLGRELKINERFSFTPYAGLTAVYAEADDFTLAGTTPVKVGKIHDSSLYTTLGAELDGNIHRSGATAVRLGFTAQWEHELTDDEVDLPASIAGSGFTARSATIAPDIFAFGPSITAEWAGGNSLRLSAMARRGGDESGHRLDLTYTKRF